jgi:hypothetical protein
MRVGTRVLAFSLSGVASAYAALAQPTVGLVANESPQPGLVLFGSMGGTTTYLINNDGLVVNSWASSFRPALMGYLLESGHLLRTARISQVNPQLNGAGRGGRIEEFDWDGNLVWSFDYNGADHLAHHDIEPLPNGNVLLIAWDLMTEAEAIANGKNPALVNNYLWIDSIVEVQPSPLGDEIVWEWHARDHLIQDFDPTKANHGDPADHPELVDFNVGGGGFDWTHANGIDYNPELDQIVISVRAMHEIWVLDHSTTTAEAAGHTGGDSGKGGDILYRWGNPQNYDRGTAADRRLYGQHDAQWIEPGRPGAGNIIVYNNGQGRPQGNYSTIDEVATPVGGDGSYPALSPGEPHAPPDALWTYTADPPASFYSTNISGVERQGNGNTLICEGTSGHLFDVDADGDTVWDYVSPVAGTIIRNQGDPPGGNSVFKTRRYPLDFPGFAGRDLTPGDPIEGFDRPYPVPTDSLLVGKSTPDGTSLDVDWDAFSCTSMDYNLLYGSLDGVAAMAVDRADCGIGVGGGHVWSPVPSGSLFFVIVGTDETTIYESSWGRSSDGGERNGTKASFLCGTTTKIVSSSCP